MDSVRLLMRGSRSKFNGKKAGPDQPTTLKTSNDVSEKTQDLPSRKRKREDNEVDSENETSPEEIRKIHHHHKIKVTDLRTLHTHDSSESRKVQKQSSRVYPQPLQQFSNLRRHDINSALLENMVEQGYREPTEVQMAAIPLLMTDTNTPDLITVSPTGSGKTLAFMIPLINKISHEHKSQPEGTSNRQVSAIILAPTKELVTQIVNEGRKLAARTGVRITAFQKGMKLYENMVDNQESDAEDPASDLPTQDSIVKCDVLVSTPLSFLHAISPKNSDSSEEAQPQPLPLPHVTTLILDEADILLDPLFRTQTLSIWSALTNPSLQTSLWSATIGSNIEEIATSTLNARHPPTTVASDKTKSKIKQKTTLPPPPLLRIIIGLKDTSLPNINHKLIFSSTEPGKLTALRNLIRPPPQTSNTPKTAPLLRPPFLIFTQTIPRAQSLYEELRYDIPSSSADSPPRIAALHSTLSSTQRSKIMSHFRAGKIWILITTDLLSRGIDFRGVNGVVNYDIPTTSASYVHRAGRTGRAGREGGVCVTLYTREDVLYLRPIANVIRKSGGDSDTEGGIPDWLLDSLPQLTKDVKKELKERGVDVRRAVKESDDSKERRRKGRNVIGTRSGYDKKLENNRRGMIEASKKRKRQESQGDGNGSGSGSEAGEDEFGGFD